MTSRADELRLRDIVEHVDHARAARQLLEDASDSAIALIAFHAVLYSIVVIGEAANRLDPKLKESRADVPWQDIVDMRNVLTHEYFRIAPDLVRAVLGEHLDNLRDAAGQLLAS